MRRQILILTSAALLLCSAVGCGREGEASGAPSLPESSTASLPSGPANEDNEVREDPAEPVDGPEAEEGAAQPDWDNEWAFDAPENHAMDPELLAELHEAVAELPIYAVVTVKDGVVIDEYYKEGYGENSVFPLHSCSKTFTGALIGLAIDQGLISGVDAGLSEYLPQLAGYAQDEQKQKITVEHLLTHTSGLEWYEWGGNASSWQPFQEAENWVDYILSQNMVAEPGSYFAYTTGGTHLLAAVLQEATGKSALEYGQEHIFGPMGMDSVEWAADPQGITDGGNGIAMTARDAAKFGQLYLDGGSWRGRQILPEEWTEISVERRVPGADNASAYGYQWWLRTCGEAGYETYYAMGYAGQFLFVVPELNLVTVMTSQSQDTYAPRTHFINYILGAYMQQE